MTVADPTSFMSRLRCRTVGHLMDTTQVIPPNRGGGAYRVHVSCKRCGKVKILEAATGSINSNR